MLKALERLAQTNSNELKRTRFNSMVERLKKIKEWNKVDREIFHNEILPTNQPTILKGLVNDWPSVSRAKESN